MGRRSQVLLQWQPSFEGSANKLGVLVIFGLDIRIRLRQTKKQTYKKVLNCGTCFNWKIRKYLDVIVVGKTRVPNSQRRNIMEWINVWHTMVLTASAICMKSQLFSRESCSVLYTQADVTVVEGQSLRIEKWLRHDTPCCQYLRDVAYSSAKNSWPDHSSNYKRYGHSNNSVRTDAKNWVLSNFSRKCGVYRNLKNVPLN